MATAGPSGGVFVVGGQIIDGTPRFVDTLWRWNGDSWRAESNAGPRNRTMLAAVYDTRRGRLVVFGGFPVEGSDTILGDLWEWDGRAWQQRTLRTPSPRDHHAMAYDEAHGQTVMFGGSDNAHDRGKLAIGTWAYDGNSWTLLDSTSGPGGRVHHAMAYDARRQRVVLYGGAAAIGVPKSDTWEWDGTRWKLLATQGPGPRFGHRMAYDAARGVTVLYGGGNDTDTWTWDGVEWKRAATEGPPARRVHAMAYDYARHRIVLFGGGLYDRGAGTPPFGYRNDVWEWDGVRWQRRGTR